MPDLLWRGTAGRVREAIVLAGGFGTRLAHVVPHVCKPMAPVGGEPFLRRVLDQLDEAGFSHVVIADGYRREQIESYFMGTYKGLDIDYSSETSPLLTGGAAKKALGLCRNAEVFVLNGDTWFDVDFGAMETALANHPRARAAIAVKRMRDFDRYGTLDIGQESEIREFREKAPCADGWINGGVYLVQRNALAAQPETFSLESDYFQRIVGDGSLVAVKMQGSFVDIGVPSDYRRAQDMFSAKGTSCRLALFDRDGTMNVDTGHLHEIEECELIDSTIDLMRGYAQNPAWRIAVVTNQAGIAKGMYSTGDMRTLHRAMAERLLARGARVDAWYFCPHHPDFTGTCDCRKPKPGMLLRALRDFRADASESVMYGDKPSDEKAATAAGVAFRKVGCDAEWKTA